MYGKIWVALDGGKGGIRVLAVAGEQAKLANSGRLSACVYDCSSYRFDAPKELEAQHRRCEFEIIIANNRIGHPFAIVSSQLPNT